MNGYYFKVHRLEPRGQAVQAEGSPLAGSADFDIAECLSGNMEQGITEKGQQEHSNMVLQCNREQGLCGQAASVSLQTQPGPGSPTLLLPWPRGLYQDILPSVGPSSQRQSMSVQTSRQPPWTCRWQNTLISSPPGQHICWALPLHTQLGILT